MSTNPKGEAPKAGRPVTKDTQINMRMSSSDRSLLRKITEALDEASDTQTVVKLIREKARLLKIKPDEDKAEGSK